MHTDRCQALAPNCIQNRFLFRSNEMIEPQTSTPFTIKALFVSELRYINELDAGISNLRIKLSPTVLLTFDSNSDSFVQQVQQHHHQRRIVEQTLFSVL